MARYGAEPHGAEAATAREEFFAQAGQVFEDDGELFETRLAPSSSGTCSNAHLADRPPLPPLCWLESDGATLAPDERMALAHLVASHRSLFEVETVQAGEVCVRDLIGGARFSVGERRSTVGFQADDILEGRVVASAQSVLFAKSFLFHPRDARKQVLALLKAGVAAGTSRDALVFQLSRLHLRWHRQRHIGAGPRLRRVADTAVGRARAAGTRPGGLPRKVLVESAWCPRSSERHRPRRHRRHLGLQGRRAVPAAAQGRGPGAGRDDARRL